jgi:hypothetical protein
MSFAFNTTWAPAQKPLNFYSLLAHNTNNLWDLPVPRGPVFVFWPKAPALGVGDTCRLPPANRCPITDYWLLHIVNPLAEDRSAYSACMSIPS